MTHDHERKDDSIQRARRQVAEGSVERASAPAGEVAGDVIDRYKLLQEVGEGGMGTVWMAEQLAPVKRRVALKIIKLGMDTRDVVVRFEAERQALALMDHPNIAHVHDGGATESGRPYFVMELVKGVPITEYCERARVGLRGRLELFAKVCEAIQHAHHKGVIHRDIKPSNVLVTLHDGVPVPKVIDFGIAKATSAELTQKTMFTQFAAIIGTPEYMAPEQAEMSGLDIDTRADVYSLGVLLYELLTGTQPFDMRTALEHGYLELLRTIREVDPAKPSTRVSTLRETGLFEDSRHVNVEELSKRLRGELDWIVMKALEKDRTRRYDTPVAFARDIALFLAGEPVDAAPPSRLYKARKFVARRRAAVLLSGAFLLLLVAGSVGTGVGWWRTQRANTRLDVALLDRTEALAREEEQRRLAEESEQEARLELRRADHTAGLMEDLLRSLSPHIAQGGDVAPFQVVLERAEERLDASDEFDLLVAATLRQTVGTLYLLLGLYDDAERHLPRAHQEISAILGPEHYKSFKAQLDLGRLYLLQDRADEAEAQLRAAYEGLAATIGRGSDPALVAAEALAAHYASIGRSADALAVLERDAGGGTFDYDLSVAAHRVHARALVANLIQVGEVDRAERLLEELIAAEASGEHRLVAESNALQELRGLIAEKRGDRATALDVSRRRHAARLETHGPDHQETLASALDLSTKLTDAGDFQRAKELVEDALERSRAQLGDDHRTTLRARYAEAWLQKGRGLRRRAERAYLELLEDVVRILGERDEIALSIQRDLGSLYMGTARLEEAAERFEEALSIGAELHPETHRDLLGTRTNLAGVYLELGRAAEAVELLELNLPLKREVLGPDHVWTANATYVLANAYASLGRDADALPMFREFLEGQMRSLERAGDAAPAGERARMAWWLLTHEVEELRDPERAIGYARSACRAAEEQGDAHVFDYLDLLASAQFATGDAAGAAASQQEAIAALPARAPEGERTAFEARLAKYRAASEEE